MGPREGDRLWGRHIANSLSLVDAVPQGLDVADVGSGAGLPGIPLAIVRPDLRVTLVDSLQRRTEFLELAVEELGLDDRVTVLRGRAEAKPTTWWSAAPSLRLTGCFVGPLPCSPPTAPWLP